MYEMCEKMDLIKHLSKLDFFSKHIGISFENQLLKKFGNLFKIQYIIVSFTIIRLLLQNFLINNNETELLILYADPGYYVSKHNTRIMVNIGYISYAFCYLLLISYYRFDRLKWLLNMNTIYNEFKTDLIELKTSKSAKKVIRVLKLLNIYNICSISLLIFIAFSTNLSKKYFFSVLFYAIEGIIIASIGSVIVSRYLSIYYIICKFITIAFIEVNHDFEIALKSGKFNDLKNLFEKHNQICEFTYEANKALRSIFIIYSSTMSTFTVYVLYHLLFSESSTNSMINVIMLVLTLFFTSLIFLLSLITGNIDFEAKKSLHLIHGCAKNIFDSRVLFQVYICG
jgi:hypothetical protein